MVRWFNSFSPQINVFTTYSKAFYFRIKILGSISRYAIKMSQIIVEKVILDMTLTSCLIQHLTLKHFPNKDKLCSIFLWKKVFSLVHIKHLVPSLLSTNFTVLFWTCLLHLFKVLLLHTLIQISIKRVRNMLSVTNRIVWTVEVLIQEPMRTWYYEV